MAELGEAWSQRTGKQMLLMDLEPAESGVSFLKMCDAAEL